MIHQSIKNLAYLLSAVVAFNLMSCHSAVLVSKPPEAINVSNISDDFPAFRSYCGFGIGVFLRDARPILALKAISNFLHPSEEREQPISTLEAYGNSGNDEPANKRHDGGAFGDDEWCKYHRLFLTLLFVLAFFAGGGIRMITDALWPNDQAEPQPQNGDKPCKDK